jgi:hypothetical protein
MSKRKVYAEERQFNERWVRTCMFVLQGEKQSVFCASRQL